MDGNTDKHTAHCTSCGCKMDITALAPYTNVVCPHCEHHTRVKCELGPYLLTSRHAAGGMSMVFAARDTTLQREVAVKILNANYSQDEVRMKQFEHEAQITAAISHPHVVKVFTVGHEYGQFYIAMEMVPGENLEQRMSREGALSEEVILPIAAEIISGLSAAQQAGLIHRDVKPGNILFDSADHAKIVDFGLSLVTQGGKAKADEIWATPYYVPPEALDGLEEDFRSDIYALGATLYHALSGKPPISEESKSTKSVRLAKNSIPPLAQTAPWLKPETCYLVDKAMAINAEERFSSYSEMSEAWQAAHLAVQNKNAATPIRSQQRAQRRSRKKLSGLASLIVCAIVALGLIGAAVMVFLNKDQSVETPPPPVEDRDFNNPADNEDDAYSPEVLAKIAKNQRRAHALIKKK
ncbi:MAG: protein kinase domain-containing protein, partial [Akkermansiaceae bacterium]